MFKIIQFKQDLNYILVTLCNIINKYEKLN